MPIESDRYSIKWSLYSYLSFFVSQTEPCSLTNLPGCYICEI